MTTANLLILTPVKQAATEAAGYVDRLLALDYPAENLSVGILESDSTDDTLAAFTCEYARLAEACWRRTAAWQRNFGYRIPDGLPRWDPSIQLERRRILALSRNHLLFNALTDDIEWVLYRYGLIWPAYRNGLPNPLIHTDPSQLGRPELGEIESFAPAAHSYIDATDFSGPEELAEFLAAMTDEAHLEYHAWRAEGPSAEWRTRFAPFATHAFVRLAQAIEAIRFGRRVAAPGTQA